MNDLYSNLIKSNGNVKLGNSMGTISKLMGNQLISTAYGDIVGTCGNHCNGCSSSCYVKKSYRYDSVRKGHARTTLAFRNDLKKSFDSMDKQLSRKRKPFAQVRINQSGELESYLELEGYCKLAAKHSETVFYVYTKNYDAVFANITKLPENLYVLISVWGSQGVSEYKQLARLSKQIKAFVYIDETYTEEFYAAIGLEIETTCKAYENHKLNHEITCDKCKKCFNRTSRIIGCPSH